MLVLLILESMIVAEVSPLGIVAVNRSPNFLFNEGDQMAAQPQERRKENMRIRAKPNKNDLNQEQFAPGILLQQKGAKQWQ